ncbi:hypothetical protein ABFV47_27255 [Mycolicibacterium fortuitum]|uniref:hypothetical protein n=1 Tax=Mycolicibacterium fortuitum TaxID=1766 RepID=UPI0007EAA16D|nr:hypothetical protein [Mycolicibacterium fortuitum]OBB39988.1 hypothetical protein A5763_04325 [Mycolicibacterium fortuitum]OBG09538.1 hypothetical protein A5768_15265 [Mycolicibacterium fortuitum]
MITNNDTLTVPVGVTPDGEFLTVDLRRNAAVLVAGIAGSGKSEMLRRMRYALERQIDTTLLFHAEGVRANADDVILAARDELRRRMRERRIDDSPAVLVVDDFGVMCIGRDRSDQTVRAVEEISIKGRAVGVHLVLATQGHEGLSGALLMNMSTRIVVGRLVRPITRVFSDGERELLADAGTSATGPGGGVLIGTDGRPTPFTALPL